MISVLSQLEKTFGPWLLELVSIYMNADPMVGRAVAPKLEVGLFFLGDLIKFVIFPLLFLSLQFKFQF